VRFTQNGAPQLVTIQFRGPGKSVWQNAGTLNVTNSVGIFEAKVPDINGASWRALWASPDGSERRSSRITVPR